MPDEETVARVRLEELLARGADINAMNQYLHTPLGYACRDCRGSNPAAERMRDLLLAREAKHGMEVALLHPISTSLSY